MQNTLKKEIIVRSVVVHDCHSSTQGGRGGMTANLSLLGQLSNLVRLCLKKNVGNIAQGKCFRINLQHCNK